MPLHVVEEISKVEEMMTKVEQRLSKLNIDHDKVIYTLSNLDALCIVTDKLTEEHMNMLTDEQLEKLVADVGANFNNIDWYDWGTAGFHECVSNLMINCDSCHQEYEKTEMKFIESQRECYCTSCYEEYEGYLKEKAEEAE